LAPDPPRSVLVFLFAPLDPLVPVLFTFELFVSVLVFGSPAVTLRPFVPAYFLTFFPSPFPTPSPLIDVDSFRVFWRQRSPLSVSLILYRFIQIWIFLFRCTTVLARRWFPELAAGFISAPRALSCFPSLISSVSSLPHSSRCGGGFHRDLTLCKMSSDFFFKMSTYSRLPAIV